MSEELERLQDELARCDIALFEAGIPRSTGTEEGGTFRRSSVHERVQSLRSRLAEAQARAERERDRQRSHVKAAYAAGMAIECRHRSDAYDKPWEPCNEPQWLVEFEYRIALTPAPQGRTDGERLDWLVENEAFVDEIRREGFMVYVPVGEAYAGYEKVLSKRLPTYREAIDAAMDATAPEVKGGAA